MRKSPRFLSLAFAGALLASACGGESPETPPAADESTLGTTTDALACSTRITYGDRWIRPSNHPNQYDIAADLVTWDGTCVNEGSNSYAVLSNGWRPYFTGNNACVIALDTDCVAQSCGTRITYGPAWLHPANHPAQHDDTGGRVFWDRGCTNQSPNSYTVLSNEWAPYFSGSNACGMSFRYTGCGGLYINPVVPTDCADPGVIHDGTQYVAACTSGGAANAFPLRTSRDLVNWTSAGVIFPSASKPTWATGDFWAPEIHKVGTRYIAYYTARHTNGKLSIGAATSASALGPFTDLGRPLVHDTGMGMIDATFFKDTAGTPYLVWKADGNAVGQQTPIYGQQLSADGLSLVGTRRTLITNNLGWEGGVVEAPWVVARGGYYYLFYSGNAYYNNTYAVGVARATSPLGPYTKLSAPILKTGGGWTGPGHNSVVTGPGGDTYMVYHAWNSAHTARVMLVDAITWPNGWPAVPEGPSNGSRPMP
ncbi:family 43 glycosylhydrolase [Pyxidicoccus fallax]|uniref:Family 43 glycosylhydrolase n=1 Tax=Pyxidicoccus fallax TaxID=394095 RepID=A0A848L677_9BACT|nr:glycoside hydrolase family 43 protein [Pyxidicoccus fallax]NMO13782.1 family 43 glycosylhydrolase [Pyxidicoccus fallax]NPC77031.1 family 43 glycosylhydrolase [Pyxidicoccus fallax]